MYLPAHSLITRPVEASFIADGCDIMHTSYSDAQSLVFTSNITLP